MGCKQSKQVRVQPVGTLEMNKGKLKNCQSETDAGIESDIHDKNRRHGKRSKSSKSKRSMGSTGSLDDERSMDSERGGSAGSKKSTDSGLGDLGEFNHGFITEHSDPDKVREIEENFKERNDLDLGITGTALATRNSAKDKARLEESLIIQKLREEGLISKPSTESTGGLAFDIVDMRSGSGVPKLPSLPPLKLAKIEKRRKKKRALTEEEIQQKLERAEERRKRKEKARLERIKEIDKADQTAALESFQDYQKKKEEQVIQKMDNVTDNRERRLREIKEKQLERERRREEVRRRKKERIEMGLTETEETTGEIIKDTSELLERQETPMVPE